MQQVLASTVESFMQGVFRLQTPFNMVVIIVMMSVGAGVITTLITQIRKYAGHRQELEFKREMLDRGLSVDEIEKIVQAKGQEQ
jgi:hypothetical protein